MKDICLFQPSACATTIRCNFCMRMSISSHYVLYHHCDPTMLYNYHVTLATSMMVLVTVGSGVYVDNSLSSIQVQTSWCVKISWSKPEPIVAYIICIQKYVVCDPGFLVEKCSHWTVFKMISTLDKRTMSMSSEDHTIQYQPFLPYITSHSVTFYNIAINVNIPVAVMLLCMWNMAKLYNKCITVCITVHCFANNENIALSMATNVRDVRVTQ